MKLTLPLISILLFLVIATNAQSNNWVLNYGERVITTDITTEGTDVYAVGSFYGDTDFDPSDTSEFIIEGEFSSNRSCFLRKLDAEGNFIWAKSWTGENSVRPISIKSNSSGIYILGSFEGVLDFDPGVDTVSLLSTDGFVRRSAFLLKLNLDGEFLWVQKWNTVNNNWSFTGQSFDIDQEGNAYIVDDFVNLWEFCGQAFSSGGRHLFLGKISAEGEFIWFKDLTTNGSFETPEIVFDGADHLYISAMFEGGYALQTPTGEIEVPSIAFNLDRTAIVKVDLDGVPVWGNAFESDFLDGIRFSNDRLYVIGSFTGVSDLDPDLDVDLLIEPTLTFFNFYILQVDTDGDLVWINTKFGQGSHSNFGSRSWLIGHDVTAEGDLFISGYFDGDTDFMPGDSVLIFESNDDHDRGFLMRMNHADGSIEMLEHMDDSSTNFGTIQGRTIHIGDDNTFYLTGYTTIDPFAFDIDDQTYAPLVYNNAFSGYFLVKHQLCNPTTGTLLLNNACNTQVVNGISYNNEGVFEQSLSNKGGCDSTLIITITYPVLEGYLLLDSECGDQEVNGVTYSAEGIYTQELTSVQACDSLLTIEVSYPVLNDTIFLVDNTLNLNQPATEYQWIDCSSNNIIPNATESTFTPSVSGSYSAIITNGTCMVETICLDVIITNATALDVQKDFDVFPTLFDNYLDVSFANGMTFDENALKIYNAEGLKITHFSYAKTSNNTGQIRFTAGLEEGVYFVRFNGKNKLFTARVVKVE